MSRLSIVMLVWFWCAGEAGLSQSGTPPFRVPLAGVDVTDFNVTYAGKKVTKMWVGEPMKGPLTAALDCLRRQDLRHMLVTYHGAYNRRYIAGTDRWSMHSWGLAIDINIDRQQPPELVKCFEDAGFVWGGRWKRRPDPIHFQLGPRQQSHQHKESNP